MAKGADGQSGNNFGKKPYDTNLTGHPQAADAPIVNAELAHEVKVPVVQPDPGLQHHAADATGKIVS